ncbi:MAG TPA: hypothetical protein VE978_08090 [Chitinophagales bacterium]|nr:hypothetical protein [Chitinophagales bacterium]
MRVEALIEEIKELPYEDRLLIVEITSETLKVDRSKRLNAAVDLLYEDYTNDKELTALTVLDFEDFYEAK